MTITDEVLVAPDAEDLIQRWLTAALAAYGRPAQVAPAVPRDRDGKAAPPPAAEFVACPQLGGRGRISRVLEAVDIGFEAWSTTDAKAKSLADLVRGLVYTLPGKTLDGTFVYRVGEYAAPALMPDPDSQQSRYVWTSELVLRVRALAKPT